MVVLVALSLSFSSLFIPAFFSLLSVASGLFAVMATRFTGYAGLVLSVNFIPLMGLLEPGISQDWLVTRLDLSPIVLFLLLLVVQMVFLGFVIWRWAFSTETGVECRSLCLEQDH